MRWRSTPNVPSTDAERQVERLEDRPLLDVQLEVGRGVLELARALRERGRGRHRTRERVRQRDPVLVAKPPQLVLVGHRARGRARAEEAPAEARALLVRPVDEADGDGRRPCSAIRRSTSTPATTFSAPSSQPPFGTESMCPPINTARSDAPRSVNHWLPASSISSSASVPSSFREPAAARFCPRLGPRDPLRTVLVPGQLAELFQLRDGAPGLEWHGGELIPSGVDPSDRSGGIARMADAASAPARPRLPDPERVRHAAASVGLFLGCSSRSGRSGRGFAGSGRRPARIGPFEANDRTMPHIHDIVGQLFEPSAGTARC